MRAAEYGHVQCLEELAKHKADMKAVDNEGKGDTKIYRCFLYANNFVIIIY